MTAQEASDIVFRMPPGSRRVSVLLSLALGASALLRAPVQAVPGPSERPGQASCREDAAGPCDASSEDGSKEKAETGESGESDAALPAVLDIRVDGRSPLHADYFFHVSEHFAPRLPKPPCPR